MFGLKKKEKKSYQWPVDIYVLLHKISMNKMKNKTDTTLSVPHCRISSKIQL